MFWLVYTLLSTSVRSRSLWPMDFGSWRQCSSSWNLNSSSPGKKIFFFVKLKIHDFFWMIYLVNLNFHYPNRLRVFLNRMELGDLIRVTWKNNLKTFVFSCGVSISRKKIHFLWKCRDCNWLIWSLSYIRICISTLWSKSAVGSSKCDGFHF